jgi:hypothetical protein
MASLSIPKGLDGGLAPRPKRHTGGKAIIVIQALCAVANTLSSADSSYYHLHSHLSCSCIHVSILFSTISKALEGRQRPYPNDRTKVSLEQTGFYRSWGAFSLA